MCSCPDIHVSILVLQFKIKVSNPRCLRFFSSILCRYNRLLEVIHQSLKDLLKALKGLVVLSEQLETMSNSMYINAVPDMWAGKVRIQCLFKLKKFRGARTVRTTNRIIAPLPEKFKTNLDPIEQ